MFQEGGSPEQCQLLQRCQIKDTSVSCINNEETIQKSFKWELREYIHATFQGYFSQDSLVLSEKSTQIRFQVKQGLIGQDCLEDPNCRNFRDAAGAQDPAE